MTSDDIAIGKPIRPEGSLAFGTIGCLARKGEILYLVTCDHVIRTFGAPTVESCKLYPAFDGTPPSPIADFRGLSLAVGETPIADLAAASLLVPPLRKPSRLPAALKGTRARHLSGLAPPAPEMEVRIWGARTESYQTGHVSSSNSDVALPHPRYGLQRFELQFALQIDPTFLPEIGDSGGPILATDGRLVGFLTAGPQACTVTEAGECIAYGVPAIQALNRLGLEVLVEEMEEEYVEE